ncbi:hypothetical protein BN14_04801 [Rhizoctonia solani AG-1 IB]|uniref:HMG box domain-containing protein n=1 Tax=Thanatephorus cucumeris (strain AG1-IB / isolate 7/3/14) TaxID=1108050 RepID=M5BU80_THACB|nr:hypothetical protein BN14_04801 [Rhizoctonia solani AG-1 IB]
MANKTLQSSSPLLFNAQLWSGTHPQTDDVRNSTNSTNSTDTSSHSAGPVPVTATSPARDQPNTPEPTDVPSSRKSVSFQVDHSPYISIDSFTQVYDGFPGASAISPASTASPLPVSPSRSPASIPLHTLGESEPSASSSTTAQVFDAFSWSAAITPHDYASAPQPYTPGHPANVAHREAMEREAYEGADPEDIDGGAGPSRKSSSSSRRRGSDTEEASDFGSGLPAGTSAAHARAIAQAAKPKSHARKMSAGHILRPRNAFIIFRSTMIKEGQITENMEANHGNISTICGILWRKLSPTEKLKYQRMADLEKEEHRRANPGYKYAPKTRKEPPARRRQKKDQDIVARRCALAAALLAEGRRGSEMSRQLEHFDREVATQIKKEKEEAARLGIRTDPYAHAHSAKKLKRLERERKERERALALQASAVNLREGVLAMHAHAGILSAEKRRNAPRSLECQRPVLSRSAQCAHPSWRWYEHATSARSWGCSCMDQPLGLGSGSGCGQYGPSSVLVPSSRSWQYGNSVASYGPGRTGIQRLCLAYPAPCAPSHHRGHGPIFSSDESSWSRDSTVTSSTAPT